MNGADVKAQVMEALEHVQAVDDYGYVYATTDPSRAALESCVVLTAEETDHIRAALHNCASLLLAAGVPLTDISEARTALALLTPKVRDDG